MAPGVSSCHYREVPPSISFSGSGFLATYQLGVAQCFLQYAPWMLHTAPCVLGASAGSLVAAAVVCEMSLITIKDEMLHFAKQMKAFTLGPLNPSINVFRWLELILHKYLPSNAHQLANGRLAVAMTRLTDSKLIMMSDFQSREDVVQALLCSCFVPMYCGMLPPSFKGVHYVDGGFSSMQPVLPLSCSSILTVSPFSGEMDICPADRPAMWDMVVSGTTLKGNVANSFRILNALYPLALETLEQAFDSGYKDAIHFLLSNDLAPYVMMNKVSQEPPDGSHSKTLTHMETVEEKEEMKVEEEEMKVEEEAAALTSFTDNRCMQTGSSAERGSTGSTGNRPIKQSPPHFDMVKNVLLGNGVTYLSVFELPARILSHLLLPLMLSFYTVLQSRHSLQVLFKGVPETVFWALHGLRHFIVFFFNIFVSSLKKNVMDRIGPVMLLWRWVKIQAQYEAPRGQNQRKFPTSAHSKEVRPQSRHRRFITPSSSNPKPNLQ